MLESVCVCVCVCVFRGGRVGFASVRGLIRFLPCLIHLQTTVGIGGVGVCVGGV